MPSDETPDPELLTAEQQAQWRGRLLAERARIEARRDALARQFDAIVEAVAGEATDDEHDPEGATIAFERTQVATLRDEAVHQLGEVDAALARLDAGTFGRCERCGEPIAPARLEARPLARRCVTCAAR